MMNIKYKIVTLLLVLFMTSGCEVTNLDLLDNPNAVGTQYAKIPLLLNSTQVNLVSILNGGMNSEAMENIRMQYQFGDYGYGGYFDPAWRTFYAGIKADNKVILELALDPEAEVSYAKHAGIAQVIEAIAAVAFVDFYGDIVYSEAVVDGVVNPARDEDKEVYEAIYSLLDQAIVNLSDTSAVDVDTDIYYGGNMDKWIKLANTLKLKMYVQTRLFDETASAAGINAIVAEGNYITSASDDFEFRYGTSIANPDTRHPKYSGNYNSAGAGQYMSISYLNALRDNNDPRLRYYFYRQNSAIGEGGYFGRNHATSDGTPADTNQRTTWGLYPCGGQFDDNSFSPADSGDGAGGAGIHPIILSSFVNFLMAEATLTMSDVSGDSAAYLESAIRESIAKVMSFGSLPGAELGSFEPSATDVDNFVANVMADYAAADDYGKLAIIMEQYWIALRGNGLEAYNNYRRTGLPHLQSPIDAGTVFPRVNQYPDNHIQYNLNATQQLKTNQVFWDTNPAGFID